MAGKKKQTAAQRESAASVKRMDRATRRRRMAEREGYVPGPKGVTAKQSSKKQSGGRYAS